MSCASVFRVYVSEYCNCAIVCFVLLLKCKNSKVLHLKQLTLSRQALQKSLTACVFFIDFRQTGSLRLKVEIRRESSKTEDPVGKREEVAYGE